MEDPVAYFKKQVDAMNKERDAAGVRKISDRSPVLYLGYFPLRSILKKLKIKKYVDYVKLTNDFDYDLFELLSTLIYARSVHPCSKNKTFHEVLPNLYESYNYSYDQLLDGLVFLGSNYEKLVELFTAQVKATYGIDTSRAYFDCTNFYFEIDREDDLADKGLNCTNNIVFSKKNGDGYLFAKSVKGLLEKGKTWVLLDDGFTEVKDSRRPTNSY